MQVIRPRKRLVIASSVRIANKANKLIKSKHSTRLVNVYLKKK